MGSDNWEDWVKKNIKYLVLDNKILLIRWFSGLIYYKKRGDF